MSDQNSTCPVNPVLTGKLTLDRKMLDFMNEYTKCDHSLHEHSKSKGSYSAVFEVNGAGVCIVTACHAAQMA